MLYTNYVNKACYPLSEKWLYQRSLLVCLILTYYVLSGCTPFAADSSEKKDFGNGISLDVPQTWSAEYYSRNNLIEIRTTNLFKHDTNVLIRIWKGGVPPPHTNEDISILQVMTKLIDVHKSHFPPNTVTIVQTPVVIEDHTYEISQAIIGRPRSSTYGNSSVAQSNSNSLDQLQNVEIYAIVCPKTESAFVDFYMSEDDSINIEARAIIGTIELDCLQE